MASTHAVAAHPMSPRDFYTGPSWACRLGHYYYYYYYNLSLWSWSTSCKLFLGLVVLVLVLVLRIWSCEKETETNEHFFVALSSICRSKRNSFSEHWRYLDHCWSTWCMGTYNFFLGGSDPCLNCKDQNQAKSVTFDFIADTGRSSSSTIIVRPLSRITT